MADTTYTPAILGVTVAPNPAQIGEAVLISVLAQDIASTPAVAAWPCGLVRSGEV